MARPVKLKKPKSLVTGYFGDRRSKTYNSSFYCEELVLEHEPFNSDYASGQGEVEQGWDEVYFRSANATLWLKLLTMEDEED